MAYSPTADTNFKVYIAIDFGTDGLGLAYAINEEDVYIHSKWNSKKYSHVVKPKTIILLDDKGDAVSFGIDAKFTYMNLSTKQKHDWMLFERFKMSLYENQLYEDELDEEFKDQQHDHEDDTKQTSQLKRKHKKYEIKSDEFDNAFINEATTKRIAIKNELIAVNGKTMSADKVFVEIFQYVKKEAKKYLRKKKIKNISDNQIGWIITVPAIWNDESKNKMKEWAIAAKLVDKNIYNQCKIVYEPDCASLSIRKKIKSDNEMKLGDKYILVDAGAGTVDIACHVCIDGFCVKEILPPSGGKWGSSYIDDQYIKLLQNVFTTNWVNEFKLSSPNIFVEIIHNFQQAKSKFYFNSNEKYTNVRLPEDFICFMDEKIDCSNDINNVNDIDEFVTNSVLGKSKSVCLEDEYLHIDNIVWKSMFDHCINPIIMHIKKLLQNEELKECIYLCLVGGLSCSPYFQFKMKNTFGEKSKHDLKIIIPERPMLCVVEGAAYLGINQQYIRARRLRLSYGFVVNKPIDIAKQMGINNSYIEENKYFDENNEEYMVPGCFHIMAKKNQEVKFDQVFIETSFRSDPSNMEVKSQVFASEMENPLTVEDGQELAEYTVVFKNKNDFEIIDEFHFYDTMLKVYSYSKNTPNIKTEVQLSYH